MILDTAQKAKLLGELTFVVDELGSSMGMDHSEAFGWTPDDLYVDKPRRPPFKKSFEDVQEVMGRILSAAAMR